MKVSIAEIDFTVHAGVGFGHFVNNTVTLTAESYCPHHNANYTVYVRRCKCNKSGWTKVLKNCTVSVILLSYSDAETLLSVLWMVLFNVI